MPFNWSNEDTCAQAGAWRLAPGTRCNEGWWQLISIGKGDENLVFLSRHSCVTGSVFTSEPLNSVLKYLFRETGSCRLPHHRLCFHSLHTFGEVWHGLILLRDWVVEISGNYSVFSFWLNIQTIRAWWDWNLTGGEAPQGSASPRNTRYVLEHLSLQGQARWAQT